MSNEKRRSAGFGEIVQFEKQENARKHGVQTILLFSMHSVYCVVRISNVEVTMKRKKTSDRVLPADWTEVVGKVQEVLTQTEIEAGEREKILTGMATSFLPAKKANAWKKGIEQFEERLQLFQSAVQQAEDDATEAELVLADGEKALEHWLARASDISRSVAKIQEDKTDSPKPAG